jgi:adenylosuccinate lyase
MELNALNAVGPIDGRYRSKTNKLAAFYSEFALIKYRVLVEVEYFIALCELPLPQLSNVSSDLFPKMKTIYQNFSEEDAKWVKDREKITNHDVKAVEYFVKEKFTELGIGKEIEFVHFGLTSQDINNTSIPLSLKDGIEETSFKGLNLVKEKIGQFAHEWKGIPMLARTHGQPASPTNLGKEFQVFEERLAKQVDQLKNCIYPAKFGGATGNFNAHYVAYPKIDWVAFANNFVNEKLGLSRSQTTTQIEHYDDLASLFDCLKRINVILIDFSRDVWNYVAMDYFKQKVNPEQTGSSAMPHKVNPIDFENAEGNLGIANAILEHLSQKLPISRLQRDLTDSTVLRNIGVPLAHMEIAINSLLRGMDKLLLNEAQISGDLDNNWPVVAEAIQTVLRREGFDKPYETLKDLTRKNEKITQGAVHEFIDGLAVSDEIKTELKRITPHNYTGIQLVD